MLLTSWLRTLRHPIARTRTGHQKRCQSRICATQPVAASVEPLEDRTLLTAASNPALAAGLEGLHGEDGVGKDGPLARVDLQLGVMYHEYQAWKSAHPQQDFESSNPLLKVVEGHQVVVDAVAVENAAALRAELQRLGMHVTGTWGKTVSGVLPIDAIDDVVRSEALSYLRPFVTLTNVGLVDSQGDVAMSSDVARAMFSVDGSGITVGTISDSFDNNLGVPLTMAADDIASGDLPAGINVLDDLIPGADEGRAMMQLIADVAPGAAQAFHTASGGLASFAQGILDLAAAGADVIVDDVLVPTEPMFQDGILAQTVDQVVGMGVTYFSAAGNEDRQSYESAFVDSLANGPGGDLHDFDTGPTADAFQQVTIPVGGTAVFAFQWDEPFGSLPGAVAASANDLDIYLYDAPMVTGNIVAMSAAPNVGGDPVELLMFTNPGPATTYHVAIDFVAGPAPGLMKYVHFGNVTIDEFDTQSPTIYSHPNAAGAEAVGAAFYQQTPPFGTSPPVLEPTSSVGGVPILFDNVGNRLATPVVRQSPDIVAPDGTDNTFFGTDVEPNGFPNFFGTSAAAPHAAGVAALMLQAAGGPGALTPAEIATTLATTAIDMNVPGFDFESGFGLIDALAAVTVSVPAPSTPPTIDNQFFVIPETSPNGATVGTVVASDPDIGDTITYAITGGNTGGAFAIDAMTGQLTVNDNTAFQANNNFVLTVEVTDSAMLTDDAAIVISVTSAASAPVATSLFLPLFRELLVTVTEDNSVTIGEAGGMVLVNGANPNSGPLAVGEVTSIRVDGGAGSNLIDLTGVTAAAGFLPTLSIVVNGSDGPDTIVTSPLGGVYRGGHDDDLLLGSDAAETLDGEDGADTLFGAGGDDCLLGMDGDDLINAGTGDDNIDAGNGMDLVDGDAGEDTIRGGDGADTLLGNLDNDRLNGGGGVDVVDGGDGNDFVLGGGDGDLLLGNTGDDTLKGQGGIDTLDGGDGNDSLAGGPGAESLFGGLGDDTLNGNTGNDTLDGGDGNDSLEGGNDNDRLIGNFGDDTLRGGRGSDMLFGDSDDPNQGGIGNDVLRGNSSADTLNGGGGADDIDGGTGNDLVLSGMFTVQPLELSINNVRIDPEGNSGTTIATFTVTLSDISNEIVTVNFATDDDTATGGPDAMTPGADYITTMGLLQFMPGDTVQTIDVEIIGDTLDELVETFFIDLSNPVGAVIADSQGRGRIIDDEVGPTDADIFLLFDDTGSFAGVAPALITSFPTVITNLQMQLPTVSLAFGIGRFEDYSTGPGDRPFILNQPIIEDGVPMFSQAIDAALNRTAPGGGGSAPESAIEALFQVATGAGFDGNGDGDTTDSGPAGLISTQVTPGLGGDVPAFSSFMPDPTPPPAGPVLPPSGTDGGVGFRPGSQRIVLLATDAAFTFEPDGLPTYTGVGGVTVPATQITMGGSPMSPGGRGATIQNTVDAMIAQGIQVVGLGDSQNFTPRPQLEGLSTLTGAINQTGMSVASGIPADPIDPGDPFYFLINPASPTLPDDLAAAIVAAVGATVTALPSLTIDDVLINPEGTGGTTNAVFTVSLDTTSMSDVTFNFTTVDGDAIAGLDYVATSGPGVIPAGMLSTTITVPVVSDIINELSESFFVELSNVAGANLDQDQAEGTIVDDDDPLDPIGDILKGSSGNDTISSSDGDDTLFGGGGNDSIDSGAGNDSISAGGGNDTVFGNAGDDTIDGQGAADLIFGDIDPADPDFFPLFHTGNDVVVWAGGQSNDTVEGGLGFDQLVVNTQTANDRVTAFADGNQLKVNARTPLETVGDTVTARNFEALSINTNSGRDTVVVDDLSSVASMTFVQVDAGPGHDLVDATAQADMLLRLMLSGGTGNDTILGGNGRDILNGDAGSDSLSSSGGDDILTGGDGQDTLDGGAGNDQLLGNDSRDLLLGGDGRDTLDGGSQNDTLEGGNGNDLLMGGFGDDTALGDKGDDTILGGDGADTLDGGDGNDSLLGENESDSLRGQAGNDTLLGGNDFDTLVGGDDDDLLLGELEADFLNGNAGNDTLLGGDGDDTALGGAGADQLFGEFGSDVLNGNAGADTLRGGDGPDQLRGGTDDDTLNGGDGNDNLLGEAGRDALAGHQGDDTLNGGGETDTLIGGDGDDTLRGGADADFLVGNQGADDIDGQGAVDTISGGQGQDTITGVPDDVIDHSIESFFNPNSPEFAWINAV